MRGHSKGQRPERGDRADHSFAESALPVEGTQLTDSFQIQVVIIAGVFTIGGAVLGSGSAIAAEYVRGRSAGKRETADRVARFQGEMLIHLQEGATELILALLHFRSKMVEMEGTESSRRELGPKDDAEFEELRRLEALEKPGDLTENTAERTGLRRKLDARIAALEEFTRALNDETAAHEATFLAIVQLETLASRVLNREVATRAGDLCTISLDALVVGRAKAANVRDNHFGRAQRLFLELQDLAGQEILQQLQS